MAAKNRNLGENPEHVPFLTLFQKKLSEGMIFIYIHLYIFIHLFQALIPRYIKSIMCDEPI